MIRSKADQTQTNGLHRRHPEILAIEGPNKKPAIVSDQRKADQKKVDDALSKAVAAEPMLEAYLAAQFTLTSSDKPHLMKF